ncbi:MAG: hypothetical protein EPO20_10755 [Betaproteobacteria bacterium]|nr:MAG: hypothetical protein EPO20_10755 [Betaproteobacteria bacterium]
MSQDEGRYWLDRPENVAKLYRGLWIVGVLLVLADLVVHRHAEAGFDGGFGFYGVYGFVACVALVLAAKLLRRAVMRPEDYYDR